MGDVRKQNLLESLENTTAVLETLLSHFGHTMSKADLNSREETLRVAKAAIEAVKESRDADEQKYVDLAKEEHEVEGELEIDGGAVVSISPDQRDEEDGGGAVGAYVQAWVWVYNPAQEGK